jgi:hypothetical protein
MEYSTNIPIWQHFLKLVPIPIVEALDQLAVPYHIGGSVASSLYGEFRPTQDVDIVADLQLAHVRLFVKRLEGDYYVVEDSSRNYSGLPQTCQRRGNQLK